MATILRPDGSTQEVAPEGGAKTFPLSQLQRIVAEGSGEESGMIEELEIGDGLLLICNEEAKILNPPLPRNGRATALAGFASPEEMAAERARLSAAGVFVIRVGALPGDERMTDESDYIAGTVLVCREDEVE